MRISKISLSLLLSVLIFCGCSMLQKNQAKNDCKCKIDRFREIAQEEFVPTVAPDHFYCLKSDIVNELESLLIELDPCLKEISADDICNNFRGYVIEQYSENREIKLVAVQAVKCYGDSMGWGRISIHARFNELTGGIDSIRLIDSSSLYDPRGNGREKPIFCPKGPQEKK
jgi:hypothetical protein